MDDPGQLSAFGQILIFAIGGLVLVLLTLSLGRWIAPSLPSALKLSSYECGEEPIGNARIPFNNRFYSLALIFLLFEVEMLFVFPWATIFAKPEMIQADARWGWLALVEMGAFLIILFLGLILVWKKGDLKWAIAKPIIPQTNVPIPEEAYAHLKRPKPAASTTAFPSPQTLIQ
jgi:NADH-quinone oxidoreductase subunit A